MDFKETPEGLKRVIGVAGLTATVINNTIGAGIYVLPAIVSMQMGPAGILGYFFCAAMLVTIMLCYMEIGSKVTGSGGSYIYVEKAFGPFAGFIINCLFFFGWGILGSAAIMNIVADSMASLFPVFNGWLARAALYLILLGSMALVNIRGAKESITFVQVLTFIKILPLVCIATFGLGYIKLANLHWAQQPALSSVGSTVLVLFFAFAGFETSLSASGEIKDPGRTIPRAVLLGGVSVFIFYLLIQTVTQGVLGAQVAAFKNAPLAAVASRIVGPAGSVILLIAAMLSCLGNTSGDVLATPRLLFAGANNGLFPKFLGKVHPEFSTPYAAILTYTGLMFLFAVSGGFNQLAVLANGALLIIYLGVILAMLKLRTKKYKEAEHSFKLPGGVLIPLLAIAAIIWLLANLSGAEALSTLAFIALTGVIYLLMKWFGNKKAHEKN